MRIYQIAQEIIPEKLVRKLKQTIKYSGMSIDAEIYAGFLLVFPILLSISTFIIVYILELETMYLTIGPLAAYFGSILLFYGMLIFMSSRRANFAERVLPDLLLLTASNIRAGMPPDEGFLTSARPEFGPLSIEIKKAGKSILSGQSFENAFDRISEHIDSSILQRTISLIIDGIRGGGEISKLLEESANELRSMESLKKMIGTSVKSYIIFIFFAAGLGAPMLYAISTTLIETVTILGSKVVVPQLPAMGYEMISLSGFSTAGIDPIFFTNFTYMAMLITSIFGGLALGLIEKGEQKSGLKYIPILILLNFVIFFTVKITVGGFITVF